MSGLEAVKIFQTRSDDFNFVWMDIKLPVMNGIEATQKIKKYTSIIPIIAQTAYVLNNEKIEIIQTGFNDYITKPIISNEIMKKLSRCL